MSTPTQADKVLDCLQANLGEIKQVFLIPRVILRFAKSYTVSDDGCWVCDSRVDKDGYGSFQARDGDKRPVIKSHRYSYMLHRGAIPKGLCVLHRCDNPACVNPSHLFLGTHADNVRDKVSKNRQLKGTDVSGAKLDEVKVREIRSLKAEGLKRCDIARIYHVSERTVSNAVNKSCWRHVA